MSKPLKSNAKTKTSDDLFGAAGSKGRTPLKVASRSTTAEAGYTARDIEVLEGLEPVRRRPGMYIGGTDEKALHHLFAEVIDNSMDEALAGHASFIEVELGSDGFLTVTDNGRGIPVDPHPKFPKKSALEVIMCTLHAGGKFGSDVYSTSGGLHGVGVSVVNALSERLEVEVARGGQLYRQVYERGKPKSGLEKLGKVANRRGTIGNTVARLQIGDAGSDFLDHAGSLAAETARQLNRINSRAVVDVDKVQSHGGVADARLSAARLAQLDLLPNKNLGPAGLMKADGVRHGITP